MSNPTPQEQKQARTVTCGNHGCRKGEPHHPRCDDATRKIAAAIEDARINASVPIHLSRPEHPRAKWCDGAFNLKATNDLDKYTCVPCALAWHREQIVALIQSDPGHLAILDGCMGDDGFEESAAADALVTLVRGRKP